LINLIDISPTSVDISKTFIDNQKVKYITDDILQFETEKRYDFITKGEVLEHMQVTIAH
jgi:2-polyprenyl-3-methyl-5-hydroxy-6-metoxy-1,4-benzoquinol methylase